MIIHHEVLPFISYCYQLIILLFLDFRLPLLNTVMSNYLIHSFRFSMKISFLRILKENYRLPWVN